MIEAGLGGSIVTLASIAAKRPSAGVYSVSKAAVWMLTRSLAAELAPHKIRVNAIGPAYVTTEMLAGIVSGAVGDDPVAQQAWYDQRAAIAAARRAAVAARHRQHGVVPVQRRGGVVHRLDPAPRRRDDLGHRRRLTWPDSTSACRSRPWSRVSSCTTASSSPSSRASGRCCWTCTCRLPAAASRRRRSCTCTAADGPSAPAAGSVGRLHRGRRRLWICSPRQGSSWPPSTTGSAARRGSRRSSTT